MESGLSVMAPVYASMAAPRSVAASAVSPAVTRRVYSCSFLSDTTASTAATATTSVTASASGQPRNLDTRRW